MYDKVSQKSCISMMILIMFGLNIQIPATQAAMAGTDQIIQQQLHVTRAEVQQQLQDNSQV